MKNVLILSAGSAISQLIIIGCTPILTRIYGTADFGQFYFFLSIAAFATCFSTLKYELAIFLPKTVEGSFSVMHVSQFSIVVFTAFAFLITIFLKLGGWFNDLWLFNNYVFLLIPFTILIGGFFSVFNLWFNREKKYKTVTGVAITQSIINVSICLAYPSVFTASAFGLLLGYLGSLSFALVFYFILFSYALKERSFSLLYFIKSYRYKTIKKVAIQYVSFPKFTLWSEAFMIGSQQFLPFFFSLFFLSSVVGLISMANRLLRVPVIMISNSFWSIFRNSAIENIHVGVGLEGIFSQTFKKLSALAAIGILGSFFLLPFLFEFFLGSQWVEAGRYAQISLIAIALEFVSFPLSNVFILTQKQDQLFKVQSGGLTISILAIFTTYMLSQNSFYCLLAYSITASIQHLYIIGLAYKIAKRF